MHWDDDAIGLPFQFLQDQWRHQPKLEINDWQPGHCAAIPGLEHQASVFKTGCMGALLYVKLGRDGASCLPAWLQPIVSTVKEDVLLEWQQTASLLTRQPSQRLRSANTGAFLITMSFGFMKAYPDMLEVGRMPNVVEDRTHFGAWCIVSAPLILGQ